MCQTNTRTSGCVFFFLCTPVYNIYRSPGIVLRTVPSEPTQSNRLNRSGCAEPFRFNFVETPEINAKQIYYTSAFDGQYRYYYMRLFIYYSTRRDPGREKIKKHREGKPYVALIYFVHRSRNGLGQTVNVYVRAAVFPGCIPSCPPWA